jgi:DNA-binding response OmpR family regulator
MDPIRMTWPMYRHCECRFQGRLVKLTRAERDVLSVLLLHRGRPVETEQMVEATYDAELEPDSAHQCVLVFVHRLRRKLPGLIRQHSPAAGRGFQGWVIDRPLEQRAAA